MSHNAFGKLFRCMTFGESHGPAIGCVIDGCPPGLEITPEELERERESGAIRGFANRGSWKFREEDINEFARSREAG